jgi:hypothetical protein
VGSDLVRLGRRRGIVPFGLAGVIVLDMSESVKKSCTLFGLAQDGGGTLPRLLR